VKALIRKLLHMRTPQHHSITTHKRATNVCAAIATLTASAVAAAGCGGGATSRKDTRAATPTPPAVTVGNRAQRTVPLRRLLQAEIPTPNGSWLTYYDGSIWVKRDDGYVNRVDPHTNKRTGQVGSYTGYNYCQGIGAGGGAIWSCEQGAITRIDPHTVKIVARIPIAKAFDQGRYAFVRGRIWLITGTYGNQLTGIDPATNTPGPPIRLPYGCSDLAPGAEAVWVLCPLNGHIVKVDVARRRVDATAALPSTYNGFATATDLWAGSNSDLVRVDATTLKPKAIFKLAGPGQFGDVTVDGSNVWVSTSEGHLYKIDATTNTIIEHVTPPPQQGGGGSLIAAAGSLWNTAGPNGDGPLLHIRSR
jgi:outer membrane protein assembly factor BamB